MWRSLLLCMFKTSVTPSGVSTATVSCIHHIVVEFPRALCSEIQGKIDIFHEDGDVAAFSRRSRGNLCFYGASWRSYGVLLDNCRLRSFDALTALPLRASSCHGACTASSLCAHCADGVLFCIRM